MTRFIFTLALIALVFYLVRRAFAPQLPRDQEPQAGRRAVPRGEPRALVCGDCGTQFEPAKEGWTCPSCGK